MKKLALAILIALASSVGAFTQSSNICFDTVFTGTARKQLALPGSPTGTADRYSSETFAYRLSGSPASVSITIEAGDAPYPPTTPATICSATTTTTNATTIPMCSGATQNLTYRYWYANLGTFSGGSSPTLTVTSCMAAQTVPGGTAGAMSWSNLTAPTANLTLNFASKNTTFTNAGTLSYAGSFALPNLTTGSIPFIGASGVLAQDNTNLKWDNTNKVLTLGSASLYTLGTQNLFIGDTTGNLTMSGSYNTAVGAASFQVNTTGVHNAAFGAFSLASDTGDDNTAIGDSALFSNTIGHGNTAVGNAAMVDNTNGNNNVAIGINAFAGSGDDNVSIGRDSLSRNVSGSNNVAVGSTVLSHITTGSNNTVIGLGAGTTLTTGSTVTLLGFLSDVSTGALTNATAIGNGATVAASNSMMFGDTNVTLNTFHGNAIILGLKTTGAAGGKNMVCVDVTTGQLYASSSQTICAN